MRQTLLIVDDDLARRAFEREWLRTEGYETIEAGWDDAVIKLVAERKPDLILARAGGAERLHRELADLSDTHGAMLLVFIETRFSPALKKEILGLPVHGFLNDALPRDELSAAVRAFFRQKQLIADLKRRPEERDDDSPLRERCPGLYETILFRYEEAVKKVLQHRLYKIDDDVFEPFRQIARELFLANATARDAVELHYRTLRKIAARPETPSAQAYLEVGRTTIIGLLGDLLTYYRDSRANGIEPSADPLEAWKNHPA
jgi:DNA-binding response OmpR family regulator